MASRCDRFKQGVSNFGSWVAGGLSSAGSAVSQTAKKAARYVREKCRKVVMRKGIAMLDPCLFAKIRPILRSDPVMIEKEWGINFWNKDSVARYIVANTNKIVPTSSGDQYIEFPELATILFIPQGKAEMARPVSFYNSKTEKPVSEESYKALLKGFLVSSGAFASGGVFRINAETQAITEPTQKASKTIKAPHFWNGTYGKPIQNEKSAKGQKKEIDWQKDLNDLNEKSSFEAVKKALQQVPVERRKDSKLFKPKGAIFRHHKEALRQVPELAFIFEV